MADDDRRMHEGDKPGLTPGRGHEHREDPVTEADSIGREDDTPVDGPVKDIEDTGSTVDRKQDSALGGNVATRSSTAPTPEEERTR